MNTRNTNQGVLAIIFLQSTLRILLLIFLLVAVNPLLEGNKSGSISEPNMLQLTEQIEGHMYIGWNSHYSSEGRDNLDGDSLIVNDVQLSWEFLSCGIWYVASPDQSYDELQTTIAANQTTGNFDFYFSYTHLQFPSDNQRDNETGAGLAISELPADFQSAVDIYYSFEANGSFTTISVAREFTITESLNIVGSGILGMNQGYVEEGHEGLNQFELKLEST